jgi:hypothetical protein
MRRRRNACRSDTPAREPQDNEIATGAGRGPQAAGTEAAFDQAVEEVTNAARRLLDRLTTSATARRAQQPPPRAGRRPASGVVLGQAGHPV